MNDSLGHLHFVSKITGILASTFRDIHHLLQEEVKQVKSGKPTPFPQIGERSIGCASPDHSENEVDSSEQKEVGEEKKSQHKGSVSSYSQAQKKGEKKKKKIAKWLEEGKPRPPLNAFMLFLKASKAQIMQARPELTPSEVSTYASSLWGELGEEEKEKYRTEYRQNRQLYLQEMVEYKKNHKGKGDEEQTSKKKPSQKKAPKPSKNDGGQEVVNVDSDQDNSEQI